MVSDKMTDIQMKTDRAIPLGIKPSMVFKLWLSSSDLHETHDERCIDIKSVIFVFFFFDERQKLILCLF